MSAALRTAIACSVAITLASPRVARACGVSSPGAPAGVCDASDVLDEKAARARTYRVGASGSYTSTALFLSDGSRVPMTRDAAVATISFRVDRTTTLELGAGGLLGGSFGTSTLRPGGLGSIGASWRIVDQRGFGMPFVMLTGTASFVVASSSDPGGGSSLLGAIDFRAGAMVGTTIGTARRASITPYLAAQAFGGPLFWRYEGAAVTGTDVHKYALGGGLAGSIGRLGLFVGGAAVGELGLTFGASWSF